MKKSSFEKYQDRAKELKELFGDKYNEKLSVFGSKSDSIIAMNVAKTLPNVKPEQSSVNKENLNKNERYK